MNRMTSGEFNYIQVIKMIIPPIRFITGGIAGCGYFGKKNCLINDFIRFKS